VERWPIVLNCCSIAAIRNVVVHEHLGIDLVQIWDIVERDLPALKRTIAVMLAEGP